MDAPLISASISVAGSLTVGFLGIVAPRLRKQDRQVEIVEFATKRVVFWGSYLKVELAVCGGNLEAENKLRDEARLGLVKVRGDADRELARVSRLDALRQGMLQPDSSREALNRFQLLWPERMPPLERS